MLGILAFINLIAVLADAISDSAIYRKNVTWLRWHLVKWLRLYIPQLIVAFLLHYSGLFRFTRMYIVGAVLYISLCWLLWMVIYKANLLGAENDKNN